jgi:hypothetical protein
MAGAAIVGNTGLALNTRFVDHASDTEPTIESLAGPIHGGQTL